MEFHIDFSALNIQSERFLIFLVFIFFPVYVLNVASLGQIYTTAEKNLFTLVHNVLFCSFSLFTSNQIFKFYFYFFIQKLQPNIQIRQT